MVVGDHVTSQSSKLVHDSHTHTHAVQLPANYTDGLSNCLQLPSNSLYTCHMPTQHSTKGAFTLRTTS